LAEAVRLVVNARREEELLKPIKSFPKIKQKKSRTLLLEKPSRIGIMEMKDSERGEILSTHIQ